MQSNDNYVTVEMFNNGMARLEAINEKNLALIQKENAEFRLQLREDMNDFKNEIRSEFLQIHSELSQVHSEIAQLDKRIEVQNARIEDLFHWNYWILTFIVAIVIGPALVEAVKAFSKSLADSIAAIFKRGNKAVNYE